MMQGHGKIPYLFPFIILSAESKQCRIKRCSVIFTEIRPMQLTKLHLQISYTCRIYYAYFVTQLDM